MENSLHKLRVLDLVLSWKGDGIHLEVDASHQRILISELEQPVVEDQQKKDVYKDTIDTPLTETGPRELPRVGQTRPVPKKVSTNEGRYKRTSQVFTCLLSALRLVTSFLGKLKRI